VREFKGLDAEVEMRLLLLLLLMMMLLLLLLLVVVVDGTERLCGWVLRRRGGMGGRVSGHVTVLGEGAGEFGGGGSGVRGILGREGMMVGSSARLALQLVRLGRGSTPLRVGGGAVVARRVGARRRG
jgi:hypothetical protein